MAQFFKALLSCQVYEKPSIQNYVNVIAGNCLQYFFEPCFLVYSIESKNMDKAASDLESILPAHLVDNRLLEKAKRNRERRIELQQSCIEELVCGT